MKKLMIDKIDGYNYYLVNKNEKYIINIEFYIDEKPEISDILYISESLLSEHVLSFGYLNDKCGRNIIDSNDKDLMILVKNNNKIYLKRVYG